MAQLLTSLIAAGLTAAAAFATAAEAAGIDAFRDKARPVIVFAPGRDDANAADQIKRLTGSRAALQERQMPVFVVTRKDVTVLSGGRAPATLNAAELRKTYGVGDDAFAIVLVGKDGGEKLRSAEPVAADKLTGLVDEMPMRKREAR